MLLSHFIKDLQALLLLDGDLEVFLEVTPPDLSVKSVTSVSTVDASNNVDDPPRPFILIE